MRVNFLLELRIDGLPKRTNQHQSMGWKARMVEARLWKQKVFVAIDAPKRPARPLTKAKLTLTRVSSSRPDADGLVSSFKHVIDGLIHAQVIIDDNFDVIGMPEYRWIKGKMKQGFITIVVEEIKQTEVVG